MVEPKRTATSARDDSGSSAVLGNALIPGPPPLDGRSQNGAMVDSPQYSADLMASPGSPTFLEACLPSKKLSLVSEGSKRMKDPEYGSPL